MDEEVVEIITEEDSFSTPQERNVWNSQAVHLLIKEYKRFRILFRNPEIRRKRIWSKISIRLQILGFNFDAEQCEKKWRNLKNYFSINEGKDIITWPFYKAMRDALYGGQGVFKKKVKAPEENRRHNLPSNTTTNAPERNYFERDENHDDDSVPPAWFADFLTKFREDEKERIKMLEEMHEDIMKLEKRKCVLLQTLIEKLT